MKLDGDFYRNNSSTQFLLAKEALEQLNFKGWENILDIGCGDGRVTYFMKQLTSGQVIGIDSDPSMIKIAKELLASADSSSLSFMRAEAETLKLNQRFECITSFSVLHWITNPIAFFQSVQRHIAQHGKVLILTYPKESPYWQIFDQVLNLPIWRSKKRYSPLNSNEYLKLGIKAGLNSDLLRMDDDVVEYRDDSEFYNYVKGWLPLMAEINPNEESSFFTEVLNNAAKKGYRVNSGYKIPYKKLALILSI